MEAGGFVSHSQNKPLCGSVGLSLPGSPGPQGGTAGHVPEEWSHRRGSHMRFPWNPKEDSCLRFVAKGYGLSGYSNGSVVGVEQGCGGVAYVLESFRLQWGDNSPWFHVPLYALDKTTFNSLQNRMAIKKLPS